MTMSKYQMISDHMPSNGGNWFDGFFNGKEFSFSSIDAANEWLIHQCYEHGSNEDENFPDHHPRAEITEQVRNLIERYDDLSYEDESEKLIREALLGEGYKFIFFPDDIESYAEETGLDEEFVECLVEDHAVNPLSAYPDYAIVSNNFEGLLKEEQRVKEAEDKLLYLETWGHANEVFRKIIPIFTECEKKYSSEVNVFSFKHNKTDDGFTISLSFKEDEPEYGNFELKHHHLRFLHQAKEINWGRRILSKKLFPYDLSVLAAPVAHLSFDSCFNQASNSAQHSRELYNAITDLLMLYFTDEMDAYHHICKQLKQLLKLN